MRFGPKIAFIFAFACVRPRTEIVATISSDVPWGPGQRLQALSVEIRTGGPAGPQRSLRFFPVGADGGRTPLPLVVGILPDASRGANDPTPVWVEVLGCAGAGCSRGDAVVAQRALVQFAQGETLDLRLFLAASCVAARCDPTQRCDPPGGTCVSARVAPPPLGATPQDGGVDAVPHDATAGDAAVPLDRPSDAALDVRGTIDAPDVADVPGAVDGPDVADTPPPVDIGPAVHCPPGMAFVAGGTFTMGDADALSVDAQPPHSVTLSAFCMDLTEVTLAAYRSCAAPGCTTPGTTTNCNWGVAGRDSHPINCVDWNQARAYCVSLGGDLPTEAQWEYAARGTDAAGHVYPWGNAAPGAQLCWSGVGTRASTCVTGSFPAGNSPFGLFDMAGNVWEWTLDYFSAYSPSPATDPTGPASGSTRVGRGGTWVDTTANYVRAAGRNHNDPAYRDNYVGFRCAHPAS